MAPWLFPFINFHIIVAGFILGTTVIIQVEGTISIISDLNNETIFETEEAGIDTASAYGLEGRMVLSMPLDACAEVAPPPVMNDSQPWSNRWILIATVNTEGPLCSISRKAKNAQYAGYAGIILRRLGSNDTNGVIPKFIGFDWVGVKIYACIVGDNIGMMLMQKYTYPGRYYAKFENEPYFPIGLLANFVIVGCLGIVTVLLLLKLFHYLYFSVTTRVVERRRIRKTLLSSSQLRKLPVLQWTNSIPQDTCSICIDQYEEGDEIRVLPCSHVFHKVCIDPWLLKESRKCPNCKGRVVFPNERFSDTSASENSDSGGDERTPLLRRRNPEDYRFVETLTESHISRSLARDMSDPNTSRLAEPGTSNIASNPLINPHPRTSIPKVTFATTGTKTSLPNTGGFRYVESTSSNAFVFPRMSNTREEHGSPSESKRTTGPTTSSNISSGSASNFLLVPEDPSRSNTTTNTAVSEVSKPSFIEDRRLLEASSSPTPSEKTLTEFHDLNATEGADRSSFTESIKSNLSFHSCQESESDLTQNSELFHSFSSHYS